MGSPAICRTMQISEDRGNCSLTLRTQRILAGVSPAVAHPSGDTCEAVCPSIRLEQLNFYPKSANIHIVQGIMACVYVHLQNLLTKEDTDNQLGNSGMCISFTLSVIDLPVAIRSRVLQVRTNRLVSPGQFHLQRTDWKHCCGPENSIPRKRTGVVAQNSRQSPSFGRFSR